MGAPLPPGHVSGGGLLSGGLLPVPQHLRGAHAAAQREGAGREGFAGLPRRHAHAVLGPRAPLLGGLRRRRQGGAAPAQQAAAHELVGEGGAPAQGPEDQRAAHREGLQHGGPAAAAPAHGLGAGPGRARREARAAAPEGGLRAHDTVHRGAAAPGPLPPPRPQPRARRGRPAGGQPAGQTAQNERGPLTALGAQEGQDLRRLYTGVGTEDKMRTTT